MGIYVMQAKALKELLMNTFPNANYFGNEVIPGARDIGMKVQAYAFQVRRGAGKEQWSH
jgi:glucose-1-phosphate adenylyltransferase